MAIINLRRYYPHYPKDEFLDVPDKVADALEEGRLIENHAMFLVLSPEELLIQEIDEATAELTLVRLAEAMTHLSPIQARRLHARYVLKKKFREIAAAEGVSGSCANESVTSAIKKVQKFFIKNGWMPKEA